MGSIFRGTYPWHGARFKGTMHGKEETCDEYGHEDGYGLFSFLFGVSSWSLE